ncbi:MAG: metal-dependent hydrolase [Desulfosarcinaceae bacterium]|jgi:membrane-bound metal-dependent hydrolase YbcI (DUF457 family)
MPLPLGHTAIGLLTHEATDAQPKTGERLKWFFIITVLANLPDVDVIVGLIVGGNGDLFHRGPTHSLLFALLAGGLISFLSRFWRFLPRIRFRTASALIFSHVLADILFTTSPVSLLWPFELNWSVGYSNLTDVVHSVLFESVRDLGLVVASLLLIMAIRLVRDRRRTLSRFKTLVRS